MDIHADSRGYISVNPRLYLRESASIMKRLDWYLIIPIIFLAAISLLPLASISSAGGSFSYFWRQLLWFSVGFFLMSLFGVFFDYRLFVNYRSATLWLYILTVLVLVAVLLVGPKIRGVKSWLVLGPMQFQPTELAKLVFVIFLSKYFSQKHIEIWRLRHIIIPSLYLILLLLLIIAQPDLGSTLILGLVWVSMMVASGIRVRHFLGILLIITLVAGFAWSNILRPYQKERILSFFEPEIDPLGAGYNIRQSKIAIGSGGFWGRGLGQGIETQYGFLPERHSDFIFASFAEEWGFGGVFCLFFLYGFFFWRLLKIGAETARNNFSKFFVFGYCAMILGQLAINVCGNLGLLPITGLSLPFLSYGGSNLLINFIGLGIIQSIKIRR